MQSIENTSFRALASVFTLLLVTGAAQAETTVYTSSNLTDGNSVLQFTQSENGALELVAEYATGGLGTGTGLGNQGAIAVDDEYLFVVDAGSNEIAAFRIADDGLVFTDRVDSGGIRPVSVTVDRDVVYVVNAGSDNISGFTVDGNGALSLLPGSSQPLSGNGTAPAQISFSQDGRSLIVTEKATNNVTTYAVGRDGSAGQPRVFSSPGDTPFGFALTKGRRVLVSEAAGGATGQSSVTSWKVSPDGILDVLDPAEPTLQSAACWVAVTPNGRFAYTTNTASGTVSAYRIKGDDLTLIDADGVAVNVGAGSAPIDMVVSPDGRYLHTLNTGTDTISTFRIGRKGGLSPAGTLEGLPDRATGLVVR